jgi:glycosyltransferase involved in cell wall biosynthesis
MTGHCAYPGPCARWQTGCGHCPDLGSYPALSRDTTAFLFHAKARRYVRSRITVVATSEWIAECARRSPLLGGFPIVRIPNGLNGAVFRPHPREEARQRLGLGPTQRIVVFSAHILDDNPRKGGDILMGALNILGNGKDVRLLLVGEGGGSWDGRVPGAITRLGFVDDPETLAWVYAAADVVAIPSRVENLPNVLIEALACGRPVVACDAGGMADGVRHLETGYLARPGDPADVAAGLGLVLGDCALRRKMGRQARTLFEEEFSTEREIDQFVKLYESLAQDPRNALE